MAVNKCVKYLLFIFNLLFWICGCIILGVSIYLKVSKSDNEITNESLPGVDLLIAIGVIIMVLGFLGCCGAIRENRCMLLVFFISLLIIFILLVAAGIVGAVGENKLKDWLKTKLEKLTPLANQPQDVRDDLEELQRTLRCCGLVNGPSDWSTIPESCRCDAAVSPQDCGTDGNYATPCSDRIIEVLQSHSEVTYGIAFGIAAVMIFGMALSMILYCQLGKKDGGATSSSTAA